MWVRDSKLLIGSTLEQARSPQGFDYFMFELEPSAKRDDWHTISNLSSRIKSLNAKLGSSDTTEDIIFEFDLLKGAVISTSELIHSDKVRIIIGIKDRIKEAIELHREGIDETTFLGSELDSGESFGLLGNLDDIGSDLPPDIVRGVKLSELINLHP